MGGSPPPRSRPSSPRIPEQRADDPRRAHRRAARDRARALAARPRRRSQRVPGARRAPPGPRRHGSRALAEQPDPQRALRRAVRRRLGATSTSSAQRLLFRAADAVEADDAEFARYLRNRARDLLSNDYESGDAVLGDRPLRAPQRADRRLRDLRRRALRREGVPVAEPPAARRGGDAPSSRKALGGLQEIEDALPYAPHKRVRADIPVGVYEVIADFGQARGTNTATILPNDPLFSRRYGRTILLRGNIMKNPELFAIARAALATPRSRRRTRGELGARRRLPAHPLARDRPLPRARPRRRDGRPLDLALAGWADALEEMKSDLVSLFAVQRFADGGVWRRRAPGARVQRRRHPARRCSTTGRGATSRTRRCSSSSSTGSSTAVC